MAGARRRRIHHRHQGGAGQGGLQQRLEGGRAVAGGAAAAAIGGLHQQHRALHLQPGCHRLIGGVDLRLQLGAALPVLLRQFCGELRRAFRVGVGDHQRAAAHVGQVEVGVHQEHAGGQHPGIRLQRLGAAHQVGERAAALGGAVERAGHHRHLGQRHGGPAASGHGVCQQPRGALPGGDGVAVGVGLPGHQGVGAAHHRRGDVGVQVEGGHYWRVRAHQRAHRTDQVALGVADVLGCGGAVQRQQHAVHRQRRLQPLENPALQLLVGVPGERAAGAGAGVQQRHRRQVPLAQHAQHAGHRAGGAGQQLLAVEQLVALVPGAVDRGAAEVVALGEDGTDRYPRARRGVVQPSTGACKFRDYHALGHVLTVPETGGTRKASFDPSWSPDQIG